MNPLSPAERLKRWADLIPGCDPCLRLGSLQAACGATLLARLPGGRIGEQVAIGPDRRSAEVIGFRDDLVVLLPHGGRAELSPGMDVRATGRAMTVGWSPELLGRVIDAQGRPLDGRSLPRPCEYLPLDASAPTPMERAPIERRLATGVRAIDGLVSLGEGQRIGLFSGAGVGKSSLLSQIARGTEADCTVLCLVGERGREVGEFVHHGLGPEGLRRSVVICATSDAPAGERARALPVATAVAEGFRKAGKRVLLLADSLTRHARALREIALSAGEPPGRRGYPPSVFDRLAALVERTGNDARGSITAIYTVLTEDHPEDDPMAEEARGLVDGHILLSPDLAREGVFPALDPCRSLSRLMDRLVSEDHRNAADEFRRLWSAHEDRKDLIAAGAYEPGSEPLTDKALTLRPAMLDFLRQKARESCDFTTSVEQLSALVTGDDK